MKTTDVKELRTTDNAAIQPEQHFRECHEERIRHMIESGVLNPMPVSKQITAEHREMLKDLSDRQQAVMEAIMGIKFKRMSDYADILKSTHERNPNLSEAITQHASTQRTSALIKSAVTTMSTI